MFTLVITQGWILISLLFGGEVLHWHRVPDGSIVWACCSKFCCCCCDHDDDDEEDRRRGENGASLPVEEVIEALDMPSSKNSRVDINVKWRSMVVVDLYGMVIVINMSTFPKLVVSSFSIHFFYFLLAWSTGTKTLGVTQGGHSEDCDYLYSYLMDCTLIAINANSHYLHSY